MLIDVDDIKSHLRLNQDDDVDLDLELERLLEAAIDYVSQYINRPIPWSTSESSEVFPPSVKQAILLVVADLHENRQWQVSAGALNENPAVSRLLHFYRTGLGV